MQDLNISIIQTNLFWEDKKSNLDQFESKFEKLPSNTDLVVLPEMFSTGFSMNPQLLHEDLHGETMQWMQQQSKLVKASMVGSIIIKEDSNYYNRLIWMNPDGTFHQYDKRHLFTMGDEHKSYTSGRERVIIDFKGWKFILMICYDLRFPAWFKNNFDGENLDYDVMLNVSNWPAVRTPVWDVLLKARAIENQAYFVASNRIGDDGKGLAHIGHSQFVDYKGNVMGMAKDDTEETISATLSYQGLKDFREKFAVYRDWDDLKLAP